MGLGEVGLDFQRLAENGRWPRQTVRGWPKSTPKLLWASAKSGLIFQCLPIMGDGLIDLPAAGQCQPRLSWASAKSGLISSAFR